MVVKVFLEITKTLEDVLNAGKIDSKKQDILELFQKQFITSDSVKEVSQLPKIDVKKQPELKLIDVRAQVIFKKLINTSIIQKCLSDFNFKLSVSENFEPDAYEDNAHLLFKQSNPILNAGLFNPTLYPENYMDKDIDACVAYVLAHELGHTIVAQHTNSLQAKEIHGGFTPEEKQNPDNQKIQRGIEFICDSVGAIACLQSGYPCDKFEAIAKFGRINNPTHTSYTDMCRLNHLIQQDFILKERQLKKLNPVSWN